MTKPAFVWCTDSVDASAIQLAQALDAECVKGLTDAQGEALLDVKKDNVIFYGNVVLPAGVTFNKNTMFNDPNIGQAIRGKKTLLEKLNTERNIPVPKLVVVNENQTFAKAKKALGATVLDMLEKGTMRVLGSASNEAEFTTLKASAAYAVPTLHSVKKIRVFFGNKDIVGKAILGSTYSEYRELSFKETLKIGRSADTQLQVDDMFEKGLLTEEAGKGITAWTESVTSRESNFTAKINTAINNLYNAMVSSFGVIDFFSADFSVNKSGDVLVLNVTTSPSLQNISVLEFVAEYFKHLMSYGRVSLKKKITDKIEKLSLEKMRKIVALMEEEEAA